MKSPAAGTIDYAKQLSLDALHRGQYFPAAFAVIATAVASWYVLMFNYIEHLVQVGGRRVERSRGDVM